MSLADFADKFATKKNLKKCNGDLSRLKRIIYFEFSLAAWFEMTEAQRNEVLEQATKAIKERL